MNDDDMLTLQDPPPQSDSIRLRLTLATYCLQRELGKQKCIHATIQLRATLHT